MNSERFAQAQEVESSVGASASHEDMGGPELDESTILKFADRLNIALPAIRERIAAAAERAGRAAEDIDVVGVTKKQPLEALEAAVRAGLLHLGENRVEELEKKREALAGRGIQWHLIGHVQSRKSQAAIGAADLFHGLDSRRLAERMARQLEDRNERLDVLVQVNTSGEDAKGGFALAQAEEDIAGLLELDSLNVKGLMTMAPFTDDTKTIRTTFARLRTLHERLQATTAYDGTELSMGMTSDFEIAVEEGSTLVRVGTALFGERI